MILWNKVVQIFELCSLRSVYSWAIIKMQGQGYHVVGHGNLFYTRAKVFILRHRKIRPCIAGCGVLFLVVRPAAHVSNRCKSGIRPVVGRI